MRLVEDDVVVGPVRVGRVAVVEQVGRRAGAHMIVSQYSAGCANGTA